MVSGFVDLIQSAFKRGSRFVGDVICILKGLTSTFSTYGLPLIASIVLLFPTNIGSRKNMNTKL